MKEFTKQIADWMQRHSATGAEAASVDFTESFADSKATLVSDQPLTTVQTKAKPKAKVEQQSDPNELMAKQKRRIAEEENTMSRKRVKSEQPSTSGTSEFNAKPLNLNVVEQRKAPNVKTENTTADVSAENSHKHKKGRVSGRSVRSMTRHTADKNGSPIKKLGTAKTSVHQSDFATKQAKWFGDFAEEEEKALITIVSPIRNIL